MRGRAFGLPIPDIVDYLDSPPTLRCSGEEDQLTQCRRRDAISLAKRAAGDVVVDLTDLRWADPSLMVDFAILSRHLRLRQRRLRLQGARPGVHSLIERVGLHRLPGVLFEGPAPAVA